MNTREAIQAMLDGKKVRNLRWDKNEYIYFNGTYFLSDTEQEYKAFKHVSIDKWEIYEEPKQNKTVTMEKWLTTNGYEYFVIEGEKERIRGILEAKFLVKLLDTYEVEL